MFKFHRHGGMWFFRLWRFGGSFYIANAKPAAPVPQFKRSPFYRLERVWRLHKPAEHQTAVFGIR